jgi:hypothetical protein
MVSAKTLASADTGWVRCTCPSHTFFLNRICVQSVCRYSHNSDVIASVSRVSVFTVPCHATQLALADVLSDVEFTREFLSASSAALRSAWAGVKQALQECGFQFFEPSAGVFV